MSVLNFLRNQPHEASFPLVKSDVGKNQFGPEVRNDAIQLVGVALPPDTVIKIKEFKYDTADSSHELTQFTYRVTQLGAKFHRGLLVHGDTLYKPLDPQLDPQEETNLFMSFRWVVHRQVRWVNTDLHEIHFDVPLDIYNELYSDEEAMITPEGGSGPVAKVLSDDHKEKFPPQVQKDAIELLSAALPVGTRVSFDELRHDVPTSSRNVDVYVYRVPVLAVAFHRGPLQGAKTIFKPLPLTRDSNEDTLFWSFGWSVWKDSYPASKETYKIVFDLPQKVYKKLYGGSPSASPDLPGHPHIDFDDHKGSFPPNVKQDAIDFMQAALPAHTQVGFDEYDHDREVGGNCLQRFRYHILKLDVPLRSRPIFLPDSRTFFDPLPREKDSGTRDSFEDYSWVVQKNINGKDVDLYELHLLVVPEHIYHGVWGRGL